MGEKRFWEVKRLSQKLTRKVAQPRFLSKEILVFPLPTSAPHSPFTYPPPAPPPPRPPPRPPGFWYLNNPVRPLYTWFRVYNLQLYSSLASGCVGLRVEVCCHCLAPPHAMSSFSSLLASPIARPDHSMAQPNIRHPRSFRSFWPHPIPQAGSTLWPATSFEPRPPRPPPSGKPSGWWGADSPQALN